MEFTELADYPLPAGNLTEWVPRVANSPSPAHVGTAGEDPAGPAWSDDPRPLTYLHEEYCTRGSTAHSAPSSDERHHPGSWLGAVFVVPQSFDADALGRALTAWMRRHEVFRTTVTETMSRSGPQLTRRSLRHDVEVVPTAVGTLPTGTRVHEHLVDLFEQLSPLRWPHCVVATITEPREDTGDRTSGSGQIDGAAGDGEEFLLVFGADHSVMDAYSMLLTIGELQRLYEIETSGSATPAEPVPSHVDFSVEDRRLGDSLDADHGAVTTWREFLAGDGGRFPAFPLPLREPAESGPAPAGAETEPSRSESHPEARASDTRRSNQSGMSSWVLSADQADDINRWARGSGHSMQTAVIAALAVASRSLSGSQTTRFVMPMHTRTDERFMSSIGWFVGVVPIEIDLSGTETLEDCLAVTGAAITDRKQMARFPYPRIAALVGSDADPRFVVSYIDARHVPESQQWSRWGARTLRGGADSDDEVYLWIVRSPKGISISARFPSNPIATDNVHAFLHRFTTVMALPTDLDDDSSTGRVRSRVIDLSAAG